MVPGRKILESKPKVQMLRWADENHISELGDTWCEAAAEKTTAGKRKIPINDQFSSQSDIITPGDEGEGAEKVESLHSPEKEESLPEAPQKGNVEKLKETFNN